MKRPLRFLCVIAALLTAALACLGCDPGLEVYTVGTEARMTGLTVGKVRIPKIPDPIYYEEFEAEDYDMDTMPVETAPLERSSDTEDVRLRPSVSKGARVQYDLTYVNQSPAFFQRSATVIMALNC